MVDSLAWGKTNNNFKNISIANPGANQSIFRKDLTTAAPIYYISKSSPHNSSVNHLSAALEASQAQTEISKPAIATSPNPTLAPITAVENLPGEVKGASGSQNIELRTSTSSNEAPNFLDQHRPAKNNGKWYLGLAGIALVLLILLGGYYLRNKKINFVTILALVRHIN